jgi:hypothetical protein
MRGLNYTTREEYMPETCILAFDIGIKNLAWCCMQGKTVIGWNNENLLEDSTAEQVIASNKCGTCSHKASYWNGAKGFCVRHCPVDFPAMRDGSGVLLKKIPKLPTLKFLATAGGATKAQQKSKATLMEFLATKYSLPLPPASAQPKKATGVDLEKLHDGIRAMIQRNREVFSHATVVLLENQPVLKNPVMKSVQMMLFASLRDLLSPIPRVKLVHAGKKTKGTVADGAKGDEGYADRKGASEARVLSVLREGKVQLASTCHNADAAWFSTQKKKSDLADCFCMCLDASAAPAATG